MRFTPIPANPPLTDNRRADRAGLENKVGIGRKAERFLFALVTMIIVIIIMVVIVVIVIFVIMIMPILFHCPQAGRFRKAGNVVGASLAALILALRDQLPPGKAAAHKAFAAFIAGCGTQIGFTENRGSRASSQAPGHQTH